MAEHDYKNRVITDLSGRELSEKEKEDAYERGIAFINAMKEEDENTQSLLAYLQCNENFVNNSFEPKKPADEWTSNEVLKFIQKTCKKTGIGGIGWFEAADRVRNFKERRRLSTELQSEIDKLNEARTDALVDAGISAEASDKPIRIAHKGSVMNGVALNWIPYLRRLNNENAVATFKGLIENPYSAAVQLDILEIIEDADMSEFAYSDNNTFIADFAAKYEKLRALADGKTIIDYIKSNNNSVFESKRKLLNGDKDSTKLIEAKSKMASELLKDYETRMRLITSPYYAIFAGKDINELSVKKINSLKKKRGVNEALKAYLDDVIEYKNGKESSYKGVNITDRLNTYLTEVKPAQVKKSAAAPELPSDRTFKQIDTLIKKMNADTRRASAYRKIKTVINKYLEAKTYVDKRKCLIEVVNAAHTYLEERSKSSYGDRRENCEGLIRLNVEYNSQLYSEEQEITRAAEERVRRENELNQKAEEARQKAVSWSKQYEAKADKARNDVIRKAYEEEELARQNAVRAEREKELRTVAEAAGKKAEKWFKDFEEKNLSDVDIKFRRAKKEADLKKRAEKAELKATEWRKSREAADAERESKISAERNLTLSMSEGITKYDLLSDNDKLNDNTVDAKKAIFAFLDKYIFKDNKVSDTGFKREELENMPAGMLVDILKAHSLETDKADFADIIIKDIGRAKREYDLSKKAEEASDKAVDWRKNREAVDAEIISKIKEQRKIIGSMMLTISSFDDLGTIGKTGKDSEEVRNNVLGFMDEYVFKGDRAFSEGFTLDTVPTVVLVDALKAHLYETDKPDFADLVKKDIRNKTWEMATHEEFKKVLTDILNKKPQEITEMDRLTIYDYSIHLLVHGPEADGISYGMLRDMDLKKLGTMALDFVTLDELSPDFVSKNETFDDISEEQREAFTNKAAEILSKFSNIDAELFTFIPIDSLSDYAYEIYDYLLDADGQKDFLDACIKEATPIKARYDLLAAGIASADKKTLIENIKTVTGEAQDDLEDIPTAEIIDIAKRMMDNVRNEEEMQRVCKEHKDSLNKRPEEYYRDTFLSLERNRIKPGLQPNEVLSRKEHGIIYIKKALAPDNVNKASLEKLDDETIYQLVNNIGAIKYLNQAVVNINTKNNGTAKVREVLSHLTGEEYEMIGMNEVDYDKAVKHLKSLNLDKELSDSINNILKPEVPVEKVFFFGEDKDVDIEYATEVSRPIGNVETLEYSKKKAEKKKEEKKEAENSINDDVRKHIWSDDSERLLNLVGDLYNASSVSPMKISMIAPALWNSTSLIANIINYRNNKSKRDPIAELMDGLSEQEKALIEGARPVIDDIVNFCMDKINKDPNIKPGSFLLFRNIKSVFEKYNPDIDFVKASKVLNEAAEKGGAGIVKLMNEATEDAFDQIGGMGIPNIFNLEDDKETEKDNLIYAQNNLRYNKEHGQGKFLQHMMNDYYNDSNLQDKRFMLSFIIKDFKKNDTNSSERKKGGDYFASSLKGAGPIMQKMMQGVPEYMVVPELRNAINVVKSDLRPISRRHVNNVIKDIIKKSKTQVTSIEIDKPLGAASVAETFSCVVKGPKIGEKEAVIKILRPDAKERMERELPIIKKYSVFADMPDKDIAKYKKTIKGNAVPPHKPRTTEAGFLAQLSEIEKEFDLKNEAENCKTGISKYGNKDADVKTVELIDVPFGENYLLMSKAEGITLDRHIKETREDIEKAFRPYEVKEGKTQKSQTTYKLTLDNIDKIPKTFKQLRRDMDVSICFSGYVGKVAKVWTGEALYGSAWNPLNDYNFRHGDLHSGNIMVDLDGGATILDYGNATKLHHKKVTQIMKMMTAVGIKRPDYFIEAFSNLIEKAIKEDKSRKNPIGYEPLTQEQKDAYTKKLTEIFNTGSPEDAGIKIFLALTTAQSIGIKLPIELQNFSQCQQRLENSMSEINHTAMDARRALDKLERMPLDKSIENSCDPYVVFQKSMLEKDSKGVYKFSSSEEAAEELNKEFHLDKETEFTEKVAAFTQDALMGKFDPDGIEELKKQYYAPYGSIGDSTIGPESLTLDTFPKKAGEWRNLFKKAKEQYAQDGKVSEDVKFQLQTISGFFVTSTMSTGLLSEYESQSEILADNKKAFEPPYDDLAFERLMAICEVDLSMIAENGRTLDKIIDPSKSKDDDANAYVKATEETIDAISASMLKNGNHVAEFVDRLRDTAHADTFEKEMERVFNSDHYLKDEYQKYKQARSDYNKLTAENSSEEFANARRSIIASENKLVKFYCKTASAAMEKIYANAKDSYRTSDLENSDDLPEYVDVIGQVMRKNKASTLKRLGAKYADKLLAMEKEAGIEDDETKEITEEKGNEKSEEKKDSKKDKKSSEKKDSKNKNTKDTKKAVKKSK